LLPLILALALTPAAQSEAPDDARAQRIRFLSEGLGALDERLERLWSDQRATSKRVVPASLTISVPGLTLLALKLPNAIDGKAAYLQSSTLLGLGLLGAGLVVSLTVWIWNLVETHLGAHRLEKERAAYQRELDALKGPAALTR
jgi:hypothetical protein